MVVHLKSFFFCWAIPLGLWHWIQLLEVLPYWNRFGERVSLVKVFRLDRLEWICFGVQSVDIVSRCTTSYLLRCLDLDGRRFACKNAERSIQGMDDRRFACKNAERSIQGMKASSFLPSDVVEMCF